MAQMNVSYKEAASQFPKVSRSYAEVSQETNTRHSSSQALSYSQATQPQQRRSYVKTVYATPQPKAPRGQAYNKSAHREIVADPITSTPNGCALMNDHSSDPSSMENMLETLITLLINIILKNPQSLPSNVASKLTQLVSLSHHHGSSPHTAMEHPEPATKEA